MSETREKTMTHDDTPEWSQRYHIGRSWSGHEIEDECPCVQEPCGLVRRSDVNDACLHHPTERVQTVRQAHPAELCPDAETAREAPGRRLYDAATADDFEAEHWRLIPREDRETWIAQAAAEEETR